MKTAREMFEELGYKKTDLLGKSVMYANKDFETTISFLDSEKGNAIHIYPTGNTYQDSGFIGVEELKAINKQIEELGW